MTRFYEPDLGTDPDSPFARDAANKLVRRIYWLDMNDRTLVMVMVNGTGVHLTGTCTHKIAHGVSPVRKVRTSSCSIGSLKLSNFSFAIVVSTG